MPDMTPLTTNKAFLRSIAANVNKIPESIDSFAFLKALYQNFSSPDGELRDELSYTVFALTVLGQATSQSLTPEQLEALLRIALDQEHLFYHIGEAGTDSIFMRSFSILVVSLLLARVSPPLAREATEAVLRYASQERDWRGAIVGKGWAHAAAHLADTLDECAQLGSATVTDRERTLNTIRDLARLPEPLIYGDDERLAFAAYRIIARQQVSEAFLREWLASCFVQAERGATGDEHALQTISSETNVRNVLRSLYFQLVWGKQAPQFLEPLSALLKRLSCVPEGWIADI